MKHTPGTAICAERQQDAAATSRRGRPPIMRDEERRRLLIEAAEAVFLQTGYSASAMSDIARRAGMSKKTLYELFSSKESLFAAVIAARRETMPMAAIVAELADGEAVTMALRQYLGSLARFVLAPRQVALYRLVISEAHRAPDLSRAFYSEGPAQARAPLEQWFRSLHARRILDVPEPGTAAAMLIAMAIAELHMRVLMGPGKPVSGVEIDEHVAQAIRVFLHGARGCSEAHKEKMAGQERG